MVDSLDTMLLLGLEEEFQRAVSHVASLNFTMSAVSKGDIVSEQLVTGNSGESRSLF